MRACKKKVFVKILQKYKSCNHKKPHGRSRCTPDLTGVRFGPILVLRPGKARFRQDAKNSNRPTWIIEQKGLIREVTAHHLLSGDIASKKDMSGLVMCPNGKMSAEYSTVYMHWRMIFNPKANGHNRYKNMPFYEEWNPKKGGAFWKGVRWIIDSLGKRPNLKWSLDVIEHDKGFVPGNLRWARLYTQARNKRHKILGRFSVAEIRMEAKRHGYKLVRI